MSSSLALVLGLLSLAPTSPAERLEPSELEYVGAFRLPGEFSWGARGASYRADGDEGRGSLLVLGHDQEPGRWAEVSIPTPAKASYEVLPEARKLTPMLEFGGAPMRRATQLGETAPGGVECLPATTEIPERCYWNVNYWYNVSAEDFRVVGMSRPDGTEPSGLWHVGPEGRPVFHGSRQGQYMFSVPRRYADEALDGRSLLVGMHRPAGAFGASQGPTLYAFRPWGTRVPAAEESLDAIPLVYYRERYPECAGPNVGDPARCDYPEYRACDAWEGGAFLQSGSRSAVLLAGVKGLGENRYGEGRSGECSADQGYHCDPYEAQLIFYDTAELARSAARKVKPWKVVPYAVWRPSELLETPCPDLGGLASDEDGGRLFLFERGWGIDHSVVVHVFEVGKAKER